MTKEVFEVFEGSCRATQAKRRESVGCMLTAKQAKRCTASLCEFFGTHRRGRPMTAEDDVESEEKNKEYQRRYGKAWREKNPDYHKKWRARNKDQYNDYHRKQRELRKKQNHNKNINSTSVGVNE